MGYFPARTVEIAFTSTFNTPAASRTWTDVSAYVEGQHELTITRGRSDPFSTCTPSTLSLRLNNRDGRFTAGKSTSPYYPNVKIGRPIRVTSTPDGGAASVRFLGYIDEWPLEWPDGTDADAVAAISATSRTGRLGLSTALDGTETAELTADDPEALYECDDPEGSTYASDSSGAGAPPLVMTGAGADVLFGGTAESGAPLGATFAGGKYLRTELTSMATWTLEVEFSTTATGTMWLADFVGNDETVMADGALTVLGVAAGTGLNDGEKHRLAVTRDGSSVVEIYVDGVDVGTTASAAALSTLTIGASRYGELPWVGTISKVVAYDTALSAARVLAHFNASDGFAGESTDARLERYAGYVGIPAVEVNAAASSVTMGLVDTAGLQVVDAFRVVESTEGGVLFDGRDGSLTLQARNHRYHAAVGLTLAIASQQVEAGFAPKLDRSALKNDITATDSGLNVGDVVTARTTNQTSVDEYGEHADSVTMASDNANEAKAAADWLVYLYAEPSSRAPDLGVDLLPLSLALQEDVLDAEIGTRIRVTGQPSQAAASSADFFIEGYTETSTATSYDFRFSVSPALATYDAIFTIDDPVYGLLDSDNIIGF